MDNNFDFCGWATRANLLCSDGRIIRKDAFKHCDGMTVPLVWNHQHNSPEEVLGHALLENRDDGVYAYCTFNDTDSGQNAKLLVQHGDVNQLSIYANKLKQQGCNVIHGAIREVSLVLAGANPGAFIESVMMHGEYSDEEGIIYTGEFIENVDSLFHANNKKGEAKVAYETKNTYETEYDVDTDETIEDVLSTLNKKQMDAVYAVVGMAIAETSEDDEFEHSDDDESIEEVFDTLTDEQQTAVYALIGEIMDEDDDDDDDYDDEDYDDEDDDYEYDDEFEHSDDDDETVAEVFDTLTDKQKTVVYALMGELLDDGEEDDEDYDDEDYDDEDVEGGNNNMKHNVFEQDNYMEVLTHSEFNEIVETAKRGNGSLKDAFLAHGIVGIDAEETHLFPDAKGVDNVPGFVKRDDSWVADVMKSVHHTPFSRIKSIFADLTEADARAKGYFKKGTLKKEELFTLLKRTTTPTTVYKKQKLDRDDVVDITDFDVIAWLKSEMRMMLEEEIARAILVGDGRTSSAEDKINEQNIRPIWTDDDVYTVKTGINVTAETTTDEKAKAFIKATIKSRKEYKGSGTPTMFMSEDMLTDCLLLEDVNGRVIYDSVEKLATALRCKKIVAVPVMENLSRVVGSNTHELAGIYVNMADYNVGADKGGAVNMFDDFDIDYNAQKYLIETRCSGALIKPYAAVAIEFISATA